VSGDGLVVVGQSDITGGSGFHAFLWSKAKGMVDLGTLGGTNSSAKGVSGDGSVVVGDSEIGSSAVHAFRWTEATGIKDLNTLLANAGVNMTGIRLETAKAVSGNGQFIVGNGDFVGAYIVRYYDGTPTGAPPAPIAGVTTVESVQQSTDQLAAARFGVLAQQHGFASPLLGGDRPMGFGNEAGVIVTAGSAAAGGFVRYSWGSGFSLIGGLSYAKESYPDADLNHGAMGALALQYIYPSVGWWRPFVEAGGWAAPNASLSFSRTYANGAGTATGTGSTHGNLSYLFARAGILLAQSQADQVALSAEYGRERLAADAYSEGLSAQNPFEAHVDAGTDTADLAKLRLQWSHRFTPSLDGTLWVAGVHGFNRSSELSAVVPGIGTLMPADLAALTWAEYGARVGYNLNDSTTLDVFANGVSGGGGVDTRIHAGVGLRVQF